MGTARDLTITSWLTEPDDPPLAIAVPGIKLTGWWPDMPPEIRAFAELRSIWPSQSATLQLEIDILEDPDGKKHQVCAYVRLKRYPAEWLDVIHDSLQYFVDRGAAISWAGGWECFLRYSPEETFAGCYAAYTTFTGLICTGGLDEPVRYLDKVPDAAARLHAAVQQRLCGEDRAGESG
jgi:hypothetical protein